jgi:hypothetical protein
VRDAVSQGNPCRVRVEVKGIATAFFNASMPATTLRSIVKQNSDHAHTIMRDK